MMRQEPTPTLAKPNVRSRARKLPALAVWGFALGLASSVIASQVLATPVYLRPDSRFPSGHHPRGWLETRTKKVQIQRWFRLETKDKVFGWAPEDHLLTQLKLATEAELTEPVPVRRDGLLDAVDAEILNRGTRVQILEAKGSWVRARLPFGLASGAPVRESWLPTESLRAVARGPVLRAFVPQAATIYVMPGPHARAQGRTKPGTFVEVAKELPGWLEIRSKQGSGFIRRFDAITASDLGEKAARPLIDLMPLRSAPLPYADLTRNLPHSATLKIVANQTLRWGQAKVPDVGEIWWPISDETDEEKTPVFRERLTTADLFSRKIFDMASSPAIPSLKFASAKGVFRTLDGSEWVKIPNFQDKNYPIAIAGSGSVFVGPFVSDDHGETFEQWIRWDTLVATLRKAHGRPPGTLQIEEIRPEDPAGRRVILKLNIGEARKVKLLTQDQGLSWRAL